tara:strand:+ start:14999 stop:15835 length:837 start_codon:yes stop_codon:yes gene_type:complete
VQVRTYTSKNTISFLNLIGDIFKDVYGSFYLAKQLAVRDIKASYRQSILGILWMFVNPITTALVWIFLNNSGTVKITDTGMPYPVFAFTGTLLWSLIIEAINTPAQSTRSGMGMMSKVNFPKEALIISGLFKMIFDTLAKIALLIIFLVMYEIHFTWYLILVPFVMLGSIFFGIVIGLFITPFSLLYSDISRFISLGLRFLMYATPVVYAIPKEESFIRTAMLLNPFTPLLQTMRELVTGQELTMLPYFIGVLAVSLLISLAGLFFYRISIPIIIERS